MAPITKNRLTKKNIYGKGMTPIENNIIVVDENGNKYEATYPKRAKGLVKNGRARFINENTICMLCPPKIKLEDNYMSENKNVTQKSGVPGNVANALSNLINSEAEKNKDKVSLNYLMTQIEKLHNELTDLKNTINNIGCVIDADRCGEENDENITVNGEVALAKIKAITEVFHHREESLQSLLAFYQKVYDDLMQVPSRSEKIAAMLVGQLENSKVPDTAKDYIMEILQSSLQEFQKNME